MSRDLLFSIVVHAVLILGTLFLSPLEFRKPQPFGEVIRVGVVSMSDLAPKQPIMQAPAEIPAAIEMEEPEITVKEPTAKPAAKIDKPVDKPKQTKPKSGKDDKPKPAKDNKLKNPDAIPGDRNQSGVKGGNKDVEVPAGSAISGAAVDNASFNYPFWFNLAWAKISQNFRVPVVIDGRVYCDVYFQVIKSGKVIEAKVKNSSGVQQFDDACLAAIERSSPFPPLPREFVDEIIGITITFTN